MKSYKGQFLAAIPELSDSNFFRSVVLMFQHDQTGASGVVLNQPTLVTLNDVWKKIADATDEKTISGNLHVGGPVEGPLMAIHGCPWASEIEIVEGVYVSMRRENLDEIVKQELRPYKFFSGYSGWSSDQLDSEIQAGGWLTYPATFEQVFETDPELLWKTVCGEVGDSIMLSASTKRNRPPDAQWN